MGTTANGLVEGDELYISLKGLFGKILRSITAHLSLTSVLRCVLQEKTKAGSLEADWMISVAWCYFFTWTLTLFRFGLSVALPSFSLLDNRRLNICKHFYSSSVYWHMNRQCSYLLVVWNKRRFSVLVKVFSQNEKPSTGDLHPFYEWLIRLLWQPSRCQWLHTVMTWLFNMKLKKLQLRLNRCLSSKCQLTIYFLQINLLVAAWICLGCSHTPPHCGFDIIVVCH